MMRGVKCGRDSDANMTVSLFILVLLCALISTTCLDREDKCFVNNRPGTCTLLTTCPSLVDEIKHAGKPMPPYIRRKLEAVGCGFYYDQPLVCCDSESYTGYNYVNDGSQQTDENYGTSTEPSPKPDFNNREDFNTVNEQPPDVGNHPNLRLLPTKCGPIESERIFGGNRTDLFEMPWMVLLSYRSGRGIKLSCGGTLITQWYVLTAAHCVSFLGTKLELEGVIIGDYDIRSNPDCERLAGELVCAPPSRNVSIDAVITHPGYSPLTLYADIALVRLSEPADFSLDSIKPICLPTTPQLQNQKLEGLEGIVAGWGATEDGLQSPVLLSVALPIITNRKCQTIFNESPHIYDSQLCAGGVLDKDSCGGDSGGPLMYPLRTDSFGIGYVQYGIVSFGTKRCGIGGIPGVYTRVAFYMDWILDNIR